MTNFENYERIMKELEFFFQCFVPLAASNGLSFMILFSFSISTYRFWAHILNLAIFYKNNRIESKINPS